MTQQYIKCILVNNTLSSLDLITTCHNNINFENDTIRIIENGQPFPMFSTHVTIIAINTTCFIEAVNIINKFIVSKIKAG